MGLFKHKKKVKLNVIQQNKKTGHPSLPFSQNKDNVKSIGFTHNEKEDYDKKVKLDHNINPKDEGRSTYVKTTIEKQKSKDYKERAKYKNYRVHPDDKPKINKIIRSDKKR